MHRFRIKFYFYDVYTVLVQEVVQKEIPICFYILQEELKKKMKKNIPKAD